jgi:hypothetical protein
MDRPFDRAAAARAFLTYVLLPAWVVPGVLDWYWHRVTKIEKNAGAFESLTHVAMALEAGLGVTTPLFFEIDAGVIAVMLGSALAHEATAMLDVGYAKLRRPIPQYEQHTHSFLEVLPFVAVAVTSFLQPEQARALVGLGSERPRFRFRFQHPRLPLAQMLAIVGTTGLLGVAPHVEELVRCLRAKPTLAPQPPAPEPPCAED